MASTGKPIHELGPVVLCVEVYVEYQGKFLIHRRADTKPIWPGYLAGPGGRIDEGEDVMLAAAREVEEETGIVVPASEIKLKAVDINHHLDRRETWVAFVCRATLSAKPGQLVHSVEGTSLWMTKDELMTADKVFKPSKFNFDHVLPDRPGISYASSEWNAGELVRVHSKIVI